MIGRTGYAVVVSTLLTLACGAKVEIGHGDHTAAGGAGGTLQGTGASDGAGTSGGATSMIGNDAGSPPIEGGGDSGDSGGSGTTSPPGVGGPIPVDNAAQAEANKVDLLLAIDNSISMAQKQALVIKTIPDLMKRLMSPHCVDANGAVTAQPAAPDTVCPAGSQREFEPLRDLHVGVITSSLGSHGASGAKDVCVSAEDDDHAHLLPFVRSNLVDYDGRGYLKWDPDGAAQPPGESDVDAFVSSLSDMIASAGEHGCGYEAQLESVYRFLVDPEPPLSVEVPKGKVQVEKVGVDQALLEQRQDFLRPDSSVVVLMLTDENDCSIQDEGYGWLVARSASMYRSTSVCQKNPNDACCQSCAESRTNAGCPDLAQDPECRKGVMLDASDDDLNLRCFHQKQRFGFDLLYSTQRYVGGFGDGTVPNRAGELVPNPLFHRGKVTRARSLFTLAVLAGVPWQDIASPGSLNGGTLEYLTAAELASKKRWTVILGDPENNVAPLDPFMQESVADRTGKNPITNDSIVSSDSTDPLANLINGHEQHTMSRDLQYACTFALPRPETCDQAAFDADRGCDCFPEDVAANRPQCNPPGGGPAGTTQYSGKSYPALRELAVAEQLGRRSVLGSICARNTQDDTASDYAYRPLFDALGRRIASTLVKP